MTLATVKEMYKVDSEFDEAEYLVVDCGGFQGGGEVVIVLLLLAQVRVWVGVCILR
jgi:hypothetical protein